MNHQKTLRIIALAVLALAAPAWADHGRACREDASRLCPKASGPARLHCLEAHKQELSPDCRESLEHMRAGGEEFKKDCREDKSKLCPGQEGRKLVACLEDALPRLTPACAERVRKLQAGRRVFKERIPAACREDSEKLCTPVGASAEGMLSCLKADAAKLSESCRKALEQPEPVAAPGSAK